jgi:hypothetical protein
MRSALLPAYRALTKLAFGGPDRLGTNTEFVAGHPKAWTLVSDQRTIVRRPPLVFGPRAPDFGSTASEFIPDLGVFVLDRGRVVGRPGWAVTADGVLLNENSWFGEVFEPRVRSVGYGRTRRLKGTCLSLASDYSAGNFAHFILDSLGRLAIAARGGVVPADVDHIYIPRPPSTSARQIMLAMGVPEAKCVWAGAGSVSADQMIVTSFPGRKRSYVDWIVDFIRESVPLEEPIPGHRVYVPRRGVRRIVNEEELLPIMRRYGFVVHDHAEVANEPGYFRGTEFVLGAHGAGLANAIFCCPGSTVLELIPTDHVFPYYYTMADASGLTYACIMGQSLGSRGVVESGRSPFDVRVEPKHLDDALSALCGSM